MFSNIFFYIFLYLLIYRPYDSTALHYRHSSIQISRQLKSGKELKNVLLDRARGFTISKNDPITGGVHCSIGGSKFDFIVTSTLASQAPPAVGRALAGPLAHKLSVKSLFPNNFVSFVSIGDGSANNSHFLSAINMAEYAQHNKIKCPVVFAISDNDICISLKGNGWLRYKHIFIHCDSSNPIIRLI